MRTRRVRKTRGRQDADRPTVYPAGPARRAGRRPAATNGPGFALDVRRTRALSRRAATRVGEAARSIFSASRAERRGGMFRRVHDLPLIATLAAAFTAAWLLGLLTQWLKLSPIVGYLLAGILIGPHTPGFVGDADIAIQLAEVGVILLMFGAGLHFHVKDLLAVRNVAIP